MILCHKHRFIFIKTRKTAGTSIEIALSKICGPEDIITPISPEDEITRQECGYCGPQNWKIDEKVFFFNHIGAALVKRLVRPDIWSSYFKFCFERNPWDKVLSFYFWEYREEPRPTISEFIESGQAAIVAGIGGRDLYRIQGEIAVDRVCLYENIQQELRDLQERLNLPELPPLPMAKSRFRVDRRPYTELLTEQDRDRIGALFAQEIASFHYRFQPCCPS